MRLFRHFIILLLCLLFPAMGFADVDLTTAVMGTENFSTTSNCWTVGSVSTTTTSDSKYAAYCSSNITGSTSNRVIGTIILVVNVPETVSAQEIFSYSYISGTSSNTTNAVGLGINSSRQLIGYWNGSAWSSTSTIDISSGEHIVIFKTNNNGSYIYIDNSSTYIQMSGLKTTATSKNGFEFGFTDYIKKFYAFDSDVDASSLFEAMSSTFFSVTCNPANYGSVTSNVSSAKEGATVTLTITPNTGYELSSLSVKDASNNDVTLNSDGKSFTMPASNVTVTATFTESSTTSLPTDRPYAMKVSGSDLYLDMENTITETDNNECVTLQSSPYPVLFAEGSSTDTWTIQGQGTITNYLAPGYDLRSSTSSTTLGWSTTVKSTSYDWTITCPSAGVYNFNRSDGNSIYYNTLSSGSCLYCNSTKAEYATTTGTVADFVLVPMYSTTISTITGGTVTYSYTTNYKYAAEGQTVTLTENPADGYTFESYNVTYIDSNGQSQPVTVNDGTFTMPAGDVTVSATFKDIVNRLDLTDDAPTLTSGTYKAGNVTYTRNVSGLYAGFCLPFDVDLSTMTSSIKSVYAPAGFAIYNPDSELLTTFYEQKSMSTMTANTPFLAVMQNSFAGDITFTSTTETTFVSATSDPDPLSMDVFDYGYNGGLSVTSTHYSITYGGTLTSHENVSGYYCPDGDGKWAEVASLEPFREYIILESLTSDAKSPSVSLTLVDDPTDIRDIKSSTENSTIYDISGRKFNNTNLQALPKGIYINGGKKYIVK